MARPTVLFNLTLSWQPDSPHEQARGGLFAASGEVCQIVVTGRASTRGSFCVKWRAVSDHSHRASRAREDPAPAWISPRYQDGTLRLPGSVQRFDTGEVLVAGPKPVTQCVLSQLLHRLCAHGNRGRFDRAAAASGPHTEFSHANDLTRVGGAILCRLARCVFLRR